MGVEEENVARLRSAYARWHDSKGASTDHWLEIFADRVDFRSLADGRPTVEFTAPRSTREEVRGYLQDLVRDWEMIHYTVGDYVAQGDRVVAVGNCAWRHRRTGKVAETAKVDLWTFRDGKAVGFHEFYDTTRLLAAAS